MNDGVSLRRVGRVSAQSQDISAHHLVAIVAFTSVVQSPPELFRILNAKSLLSEIVRHRMIELDGVADEAIFNFPATDRAFEEIEVVHGGKDDVVASRNPLIFETVWLLQIHDASLTIWLDAFQD